MRPLYQNSVFIILPTIANRLEHNINLSSNRPYRNKRYLGTVCGAPLNSSMTTNCIVHDKQRTASTLRSTQERKNTNVTFLINGKNSHYQKGDLGVPTYKTFYTEINNLI